MAHIERIFITTPGFGGRVYKDSYHRLVRSDPESTNSGTPKRYGPWGADTIYFDKTTDREYSATLLYKQKPPMVMTGTDYPIVQRDLQPALTLGVKWKVAADKGDRRADQFQRDYESRVLLEMTDANTYLESGLDSMEQPGEANDVGSQPTYEEWLGSQFY